MHKDQYLQSSHPSPKQVPPGHIVRYHFPQQNVQPQIGSAYAGFTKAPKNVITATSALMHQLQENPDVFDADPLSSITKDLNVDIQQLLFLGFG